MTEEEKLELDAFFRLLLFRGLFAYVLYGDKPVSGDDYAVKYRKGNQGGIRYSRLSLSNMILHNGWRVWEKYRHHFPSKTYLLNQFNHKNNNGTAFILLINKKAFRMAFIANRADFVSRYGPSITAEKMLEKCLFDPDFKSYHELQGILFGYGPINAHLFQRRRDLQTQIKRHPLQSLRRYKEIEEINSRLQAFQDDAPTLSLMPLPHFAADRQHKQTIALKRKYRKQRKAIAQHYQDGNFLELTLLQFMQ